MQYDLSQSISQRSIGEKDAENQRIAEIADEIRRRSQVYEAESGTGKVDEGRYSNGTYVVWDVVPRNVLVDADGDMYVVDAEIKRV